MTRGRGKVCLAAVNQPMIHLLIAPLWILYGRVWKARATDEDNVTAVWCFRRFQQPLASWLRSDTRWTFWRSSNSFFFHQWRFAAEIMQDCDTAAGAQLLHPHLDWRFHLGSTSAASSAAQLSPINMWTQPPSLYIERSFHLSVIRTAPVHTVG